jgi:hypothetical protein
MTIARTPEPVLSGEAFIKPAALLGAVGALISVVTALLGPAGLLPETTDAAAPGFATLTTVDLLADLMLLAGLAGFARTGAATGGLARVGLIAAFGGLGLYAAADALTFAYPLVGESLHPISVPLTGLGMLLAGTATVRTKRWLGWRRWTPLLCGLVPFLIELPGFILLGDSPTLGYVIACTWAAWLALNAATATAPDCRRTQR